MDILVAQAGDNLKEVLDNPASEDQVRKQW